MWRLDLICCGWQDGHVVRETWAEADEFRQDWSASHENWSHERVAIMVDRTPRSDCCMPACGCYGTDTSDANPNRPCEPCGIRHAMNCVGGDDRG